MLSRIHLSNFQGYKGSKTIELAPLTLIFGPNSGGKSSLIRSLLLLKQSLVSSEQYGAELTYVGQSVNLVGFANSVFGHDTKERLQVGCEIRNPGILEPVQTVGIRYEADINGIKTVWLDFELHINKDQLGLPEGKDSGHVTIRLEPQKSNEEPESMAAYEVGGNLWQAVRIDNSALLDAIHVSVGRTLTDIRREKDKTVRDEEGGENSISEFVERGEEFWKEIFSNISLRYLLPNDRSLGFANQRKRGVEGTDLLGARFVLSVLLNGGNSIIGRHFDGIEHLDPLREIPARIEIGKEQSNKETLKKVNGWIEQLTEGRFSLDSSASELPNASFLGNVTPKLLIDNHTGTKVSFQDVGVGLSQVEPILAALQRAGSKPLKRSGGKRKSDLGSSTLLIQQPELHLHPKMQSDLMNVFVEAINTPNANLQIIAETHSENMVLRLQRKIRDREIDIDQVSILYAEKDPHGEGNRISRLELDSDGQFLSTWPMSFLDIRLDDLL